MKLLTRDYPARRVANLNENDLPDLRLRPWRRVRHGPPARRVKNEPGNNAAGLVDLVAVVGPPPPARLTVAGGIPRAQPIPHPPVQAELGLLLLLPAFPTGLHCFPRLIPPAVWARTIRQRLRSGSPRSRAGGFRGSEKVEREGPADGVVIEATTFRRRARRSARARPAMGASVDRARARRRWASGSRSRGRSPRR
jgi:hypothetical protein